MTTSAPLPRVRQARGLDAEAVAEGHVAAWKLAYPGLVDTWVLDQVDRGDAAVAREAGVEVELRDTVMRSHADRQRLATEILDAHLPR